MISKTPFLSKVYEAFVAEWLLAVIRPFLDPAQCGLKGLSISHYLIRFTHFIHETLDHKTPHAVVAAYIDLSKAFNRVDHTLLIQDLYDMHCPSWLLNILVSYLSDRVLVLRYRRESAGPRTLPGGGPQGTLLGGLIFIVKFNGAMLRPPIPSFTLLPARNPKVVKLKNMDDASIAAGVNLKQHLREDPVDREKPLTFSERSGHVLGDEHNILQSYLEDFESFTISNKIKINKNKTKVMKFTRSRKLDFPLEVSFSDNMKLEFLTEVKLLGVMITSNLSWQSNTDYICEKAMKKMWLLRSMKKSGLSYKELLDAYCKEVRSILELAVPVWHSGLSKKQQSQIERVQKVALVIILGENYSSYDVACTLAEMEPLGSRREGMGLKFIKKILQAVHLYSPHAQNHPILGAKRRL